MRSKTPDGSQAWGKAGARLGQGWGKARARLGQRGGGWSGAYRGLQVSKTTATSTEVIMKTDPSMKVRKKKMANTPPAEFMSRARRVGAITCEELRVGLEAGWG